MKDSEEYITNTLHHPSWDKNQKQISKKKKAEDPFKRGRKSGCTNSN